MAALTVATKDGGTTTIGQKDVEALASSLSGELLTPESPGYDEARTVTTLPATPCAPGA